MEDVSLPWELEWVKRVAADDPEIVGFMTAHPFEEIIGFGAFKQVYLNKGEAVGLTRDPFQAEKEIHILKELKSMGLRTVEVREFVVREKWAAIVMELLYPPNLKDGEKLTRRRCHRITRKIEEAGLFVVDLQCLADADGKIVLVDPLSMRKRKSSDAPQKIRYGDWWDSVWGWDRP